MTFAAEPTTSMGELCRGWRTIAACSVGMALGLSPHLAYTIGIFATALSKSMGWPRSHIMGALAFSTVALVLLPPLVGRLIDRVGARRVAIVSTIGVACGHVALATINSMSAFYFAWVLFATLGLGTIPLTFAKIISAQFDRARGIALGLVMAGSGVAGAIYPFLLAWIIPALGWRGAYLALAVPPIAISVPILMLWLKDPDRAARDTVAPLAADGITVGAALQSWRFWISAAASLAFAVGSGGLLPNLMPVLTETGLASGRVTQALSMMALSVIVGRIGCGFLLDRLRAPFVAVIVAAPAALCMIALATAPGQIAALLLVVALGLVAGAEFDLTAYIVSRYFGRRHYSELYAIQLSIIAVGAGFSPGLIVVIRDRFASYAPVLWLEAVILLGGALMLLTLGRYPARIEAE